MPPHGLPQRLPPAPSTAPRRTHSEQSQPQLPDFSSMASNYLNMLAQKPTDNTMPADGPVIPPPPAGSSDNFQDIFAAVLEGNSVAPKWPYQATDLLSASMPPPPTPATPDLWTSPAFSNFGDEFPPFSPDEELLNTPVVADDSDMLTGMLFGGAEFSGDLFPPMDYAEFSTEKPTPPVPAMSLPDNLHTFTPESPMLHDFHRPSINPSAIYPSPISADLSSFPSPAPPVTQNLPKNRSAAQSTEPEVSSRRRSSGPTGTRKGVTPDALVPVDAPTQPRKYVTPSATSRKEVPLVFAKKRARSTAFGDEEDEFTEVLPPNATEKETIEYKRRQNTVAARRSRKRKLQYQQDLEQKVERLQRESDVWRTRATLCQNMLIQHGVPFTPFPDSIED
ncbi:hypothetical protein H0H81_010720 [Sphagnurus paluster]|uniref:BZIP domain-containing protein n=1 Tax=Sphagnurus paluster TaxID=117069 RepID=A0A9P7K2H5_9AGAR|nr:hypothetical protein H0H81_010720 [Sphagnurus paluster]